MFSLFLFFGLIWSLTNGIADLECNPVITGNSAGGLWGDPHFTTFNGVYEHFQGDFDGVDYDSDSNLAGRREQIQYYLMTSCDPDDTVNQPFRMIGTFAQYVSGPMTVLNYITLELFDNTDNEVYYVFLTPGNQVTNYTIPIRKYGKKSDGIGPNLRENTLNGYPNMRGYTRLSVGDNAISDKFNIYLSSLADNTFTTILTIDDSCDLQFTMTIGGTPSYLYRWNYISIVPPDCYRCTNCGLFGDFQTAEGVTEMLRCDGTVQEYTSTWLPGSDGYDPEGWSYEKEYYDNNCGSPSTSDYETPVGFECDESLEAEIITAATLARNELSVCCRNIGGGFCTNLLEGVIDDTCVAIEELGEYASDDIDTYIQDGFTDIVESECNSQGKFGPVPKLLYDFQPRDDVGELSELMSYGDPSYDLQAVGDAKIVNGKLICDGNGDYLYSKDNFDFAVGAHSLEVLVSIGALDSRGGGTIAIDSKYTDDEDGLPYYVSTDTEIHEFDSIVYNENNANEWILGSNYFTRTRDATNNAVQMSTTTETSDTVNTEIQLVAVYDVDEGLNKLYRNGEEVLNYEPAGGFMEKTENFGVRMMFCQRHMYAGLEDFEGKIRYGSYYDYALTQDEVELLYNTGIVEIGSETYENVGDELQPGQKLTEGQALVSLSGQYVAPMQVDGNFVVYDTYDNNAVLFSTGSANNDDEAYLLLNEDDGELVVYSPDDNGNSYESSKTITGLNNAEVLFLIMQDDGNLVGYATDGGLIAYFDINGLTDNYAIRPGGVPVYYSSSGKSSGLSHNDLSLHRNMFNNNGRNNNNIHYIWISDSWIIGLLLIVNIAIISCLIYVCYKWKTEKEIYSRVKMVDSDGISASDMEEQELVQLK